MTATTTETYTRTRQPNGRYDVRDMDGKLIGFIVKEGSRWTTFAAPSLRPSSVGYATLATATDALAPASQPDPEPVATPVGDRFTVEQVNDPRFAPLFAVRDNETGDLLPDQYAAREHAEGAANGHLDAAVYLTLAHAFHARTTWADDSTDIAAAVCDLLETGTHSDRVISYLLSLANRHPAISCSRVGTSPDPAPAIADGIAPEMTLQRLTELVAWCDETGRPVPQSVRDGLTRRRIDSLRACSPNPKTNRIDEANHICADRLEARLMQAERIRVEVARSLLPALTHMYSNAPVETPEEDEYDPFLDDSIKPGCDCGCGGDLLYDDDEDDDEEGPALVETPAPLRVLVGCEFSGIVRQAFLDRGHDAWSCDLLPAEDGSSHHLQCDVFEAIEQHGPWDLAIFHPPCTDLAVSGARWFPEKRADGRQDRALEFVRRLLDADIPRIALENPVSIISSRIRRPDQIIQPYEFGHGEVKRTCLWLKNLPRLIPTDIVAGREARVHRMPPSPDRWRERSRTFAGIAAAMAEQWSPDLPRSVETPVEGTITGNIHAYRAMLYGLEAPATTPSTCPYCLVGHVSLYEPDPAYIRCQDCGALSFTSDRAPQLPDYLDRNDYDEDGHATPLDTDGPDEAPPDLMDCFWLNCQASANAQHDLDTDEPNDDDAYTWWAGQTISPRDPLTQEAHDGQ